VRTENCKETDQGCRQLTPRQVKFAQYLLGGTTLTEAARNAGYSGKNLAQSGHQALKAIRLSMPELLEEAGLTSRVLIEKYLVPMLSATTKKCLHHKGRFVYSRALPDYRTRVMALDMVFNLMGAYETSKPVTAPDAGVKVIVLDAPRPPRPVVTTAQTPVLPSYTLSDHSRDR
jgi:hypothetical protein